MAVKQLKILGGIALGTILQVLILFVLAESHSIGAQDFERKLIPDFVKQLTEIAVADESYVAGLTERHLYIGNVKKPGILSEIDLQSMEARPVQIRIDGADISHSYIRIDSPYFYVSDGHVPAIYFGRIENWTGRNISQQQIPFIDARMIGPASSVLRSINDKNENELVKLADQMPQITVATNALVKQHDGLYSTAGALHYSKRIHSIIYVYYFRNEYIVLDTLMNVKAIGKTIDTVSIAKVNSLQIAEDTYTHATTLEIVNRTSFVFREYLFVCSNIMGTNDQDQVFKNSSTIDVYRLTDLTYRFSFRLPDYEDEKMKSFYVHDGMLVGCYQARIALFKLDQKHLRRDFDPSAKASTYEKDILQAGKISASLVEE